MSTSWPIGPNGRKVSPQHGTSEGASADPLGEHPPAEGRRVLTPAELHAQRVAWGKLWGERIRQATRKWKGEL